MISPAQHSAPTFLFNVTCKGKPLHSSVPQTLSNSYWCCLLAAGGGSAAQAAAAAEAVASGQGQSVAQAVAEVGHTRIGCQWHVQ